MNKWFTSTISHKTKLKLFCFPYAGGGRHVYSKWEAMLPNSVQVLTLSLPGRDEKISHPLIYDLSVLLNILETSITPYLDTDTPYVFFGHSMGALIAYELTRRLARNNTPLPKKLFVSGRSSPTSSSHRKAIHNLTDKDFINELKKINGLSKKLIENDEFMSLMLPMLRSDFKMIETWDDDSTDILPIPITALGGIDDKNIPIENLLMWRECTASSFDIQLFEGEHFYIHTSEKDLLNRLTYEMTKIIDIHEEQRTFNTVATTPR